MWVVRYDVRDAAEKRERIDEVEVDGLRPKRDGDVKIGHMLSVSGHEMEAGDQAGTER